MITGLVLHPGWQLQLDMPGRPRVAIGLAVFEELPVRQHSGCMRAVRNHHRIRHLLVLHGEPSEVLCWMP